MKRFKVLPGRYKPHDISQENYEKYIGKDKKYFRKADSAKGNDRHYAVCPACDNPIQLIGLYAPIEGGRDPYGKHVNIDLPGVAKYSEFQYHICPYSKPNHGDLPREFALDEISDLHIEIYNTVRDYYDKIVYMMESILGARISKRVAEQLLDGYLSAKGYVYYYATLYNIPWMVLYMQGRRTLYRSVLEDDGELARYFEATDDIELVPVDSDGKFVQMKEKRPAFYQYMLLHHRRGIENDEVHETVQVIVLRRDDIDDQKWEYVHKYDLDINEYRFPALIASAKALEYRNDDLLEIAKKKCMEQSISKEESKCEKYLLSVIRFHPDTLDQNPRISFRGFWRFSRLSL